jgi:hypothetical protein
MAHGDAREGKWRGNWRMQWVASTLDTTSEHGVSSITTANAHTSAASSRLNWRPRWFKWTRPFRRKTKFGFCAFAITFPTQSTSIAAYHQIYGLFFYLFIYLFTYLFIYSFIYLLIYLFVYLFTYLFIYFICLFIYKFCPFLYLNFPLRPFTSTVQYHTLGKYVVNLSIWLLAAFANQRHLEYSLTKRYQQQCAHRPECNTFFRQIAICNTNPCNSETLITWVSLAQSALP